MLFKRKTESEQHDRGYVWALKQYLAGVSPLEIEASISCFDPTAFDYGIKYFLLRYNLYQDY